MQIRSNEMQMRLSYANEVLICMSDFHNPNKLYNRPIDIIIAFDSCLVVGSLCVMNLLHTHTE